MKPCCVLKGNRYIAGTSPLSSGSNEPRQVFFLAYPTLKIDLMCSTETSGENSS
jgi:hypothetical protein